jgi:hypothetical protein
VWFWGAQCTVDRPDSRDCLAPAAATIPQPAGLINPGNTAVPGQGNGFVGPFRNFGISDTPSNYDYTFRGGIFAGDYNGMATDPQESSVWAFWTDARNGRSSANPLPPGTFQTGRNPICEQSDVMLQAYSSSLGDDDDRRRSGGEDEGASPGQDHPRREDAMFLITPCPVDSAGRRR